MKIIFKENYRIVYPSDFYIIVNGIVDKDGVELDLSSATFYFEFFGASAYAKLKSGKSISDSEKYIVSYDGVDRVNNIYSDGSLKFVFEEYPITSGTIYYKQVEGYSNADFGDGTEDVFAILRSDIQIVTTGSNQADNMEVTVALGVLKGEQGIQGEPGNSYVLTTQDMQEIATEAAGMVEVPAKIELFIDMWNSACGKWGTYNSESGYFELNYVDINSYYRSAFVGTDYEGVVEGEDWVGCNDITYEEALEIYYYQASPVDGVDGYYCGATIKTNISGNLYFRNRSAGYSSTTTKNSLAWFARQSSLYMLNVIPKNLTTITLLPSSMTYFTYASYNLHTVLGYIYMGGVSALTSALPFGSAIKNIFLLSLTNSVNFSNSSNLARYAILYMLVYAENTSAITITLHQDAYDRLTDADKEYAANKNITIAI